MARALLREPAGDFQTQAAESADDEIRGVRANRRFFANRWCPSRETSRQSLAASECGLILEVVCSQMLDQSLNVCSAALRVEIDQSAPELRVFQCSHASDAPGERLSHGDRISRSDRLRAAGYRPDTDWLFPAGYRLE